jgi:hypothetical protein
MLTDRSGPRTGDRDRTRFFPDEHALDPRLQRQRPTLPQQRNCDNDFPKKRRREPPIAGGPDKVEEATTAAGSGGLHEMGVPLPIVGSLPDHPGSVPDPAWPSILMSLRDHGQQVVRATRVSAFEGRAGVPDLDPEVIGDIDSGKMGFPRTNHRYQREKPSKCHANPDAPDLPE